MSSRRFVKASTQYIAITSAAVTTTPLTLACWFYADTLVDCSAFSLGSAGGSHIFTLQPWSDGFVYATTQEGGTAAFATSGTTYSSGTWIHIAAVFAASNSRAVYINGANKGTNTTTVSVTGLDRTTLGALATAGSIIQLANGRMTQAGCWNVALTDDEIYTLSRGFSPLFVRPGKLVHYLPLDEDQFAYDWIGGKYWTITGATNSDLGPNTIIQPADRRHFIPGLGAGGGSTFKAYFARGANVTVYPGVRTA